jgi:predicted ATPase/class 3 adenylate cyclase
MPTGTVTFLFTDLEGSTRLWEQHPRAMRTALARHDGILRDAVVANGGLVVKSTGDGLHAVFRSAECALAAAAAGQRALTAEEWDETGSLRVRMGIHTGASELRDEDYFGPALNRAARLMAVAHGGQVLVSLVTEELVRDSLVSELELVELGEHRLRDLSRPERIFQLRAPGLAFEFPALRSLDSLPGNLPTQVTSFVGREDELVQVAAALADARLVTLTGVGGVGKTRLALEVAAEVVPAYRDGAWVVELAGVRDPEAVPDAVLAAFGLQAARGRPALDTLLEFLAAKELLLMLDNCEHLLAAVAGVVGEILRGCPDVRVLATSREGLNVAGERMMGVASLRVPSEGAGLEAVMSCEAAELFVDRARGVKPGFTLDATNAGSVAQVCRRLDGIALAIELAAARASMLTPADLAERLDQRFRLLGGGHRGGVERHQTLRAAIDWSYELLSEAEQRLLAALSVFAGGFSLEAAEAVATAGGVDADQVFELLAALVARSLVVADTEGIEARYGLLETIRQYAQEHLDHSGAGAELHTAHGSYYAAFGETAIANIWGLDGAAWERRLRREYDNFRAAITWSVETKDLDLAVRLFAMWAAHPPLTDAAMVAAFRWAVDRVLELPAAAEHTGYADALLHAAMIAYWQGDPELARRRSDQAEELQQRFGVTPRAQLWLVRTNLALAQGRLEDARRNAESGVAVARAGGEVMELAITLAQRALVRTLMGDSDGAGVDAEAALGLTHRVPNRQFAQGPLAFAAFALCASKPTEALALVREVVQMSEPGEASLFWGIAGDIAARQGHRIEALTYLGRGVQDAHWLGYKPVVGNVLGWVAILLVDSDPEVAAELFGAADSLAHGYAHAPHFRKACEEASLALDRKLGAARRLHLFQRGEQMNPDEVVARTQVAVAGATAEDPAREATTSSTGAGSPSWADTSG